MQAGKSATAQRLETTHGFKRVKLAAPMKDMLRTFLSHLGYAPHIIEQYIEGNAKEDVIAELGITARRAMQTLGTEWGRTCCDVDMWANIAVRDVEHFTRYGHSTVIDDMRFPNEMRLLKEAGARCIRIVADRNQVSTDHPSEGLLDNEVFDYTLVNDGDLIDLHSKVDNYVRLLQQSGN
jgi:hypothetical protein